MSRLMQSEGRWIRALLVLSTLTVALVLTGLVANVVVYFSDIILILVMAWVFAFILSPLVELPKRVIPGLPRTLVVVTVYALLFLILSAIVLLIAAQLAESIAGFTDDLPTLQQQLPEILAPWQERLAELGLQVDLVLVSRQVLGPVPGAAPGAGAGEPEHAGQPALHDLPVAVHRPRQGPHPGLRQPHHPATLRQRDAPLPDQRGSLVRRLHPGPGRPGRRLRRHRRRRERGPGHRVRAAHDGARGHLPDDPVLRALRLLGAPGR